MAPNICGFLVQYLCHVALLAPRILSRLIDFWKICVPLVYCFLIHLLVLGELFPYTENLINNEIHNSETYNKPFVLYCSLITMQK